MSFYIYPFIPSVYDVEDAFSSTNAPNYIPTPPGYSLVTPGNISPDSSDDLTKDILSSLSISHFHDDPYMNVIQAYDAIPPPPNYFFDKSIFVKLDNLLWIIRRPLGSKPVLEKPDESDTCYNVHL
ncbi:hypothetical protein Tco_1486521 [Tanacetum coccineum]